MATALIQRRRRPLSAKRMTRTGLFHGGSIILAVAFLFPIIWAALNSVKTTDEANAQPPTWLPHSLSLQNYRTLSGFDQGIGTYLVNTILLCVLTVALSVTVCLLGGYGFARYTFRGKNLLFGATLGILMVPYATILLPLYIVIGRLGLHAHRARAGTRHVPTAVRHLLDAQQFRVGSA
jgi:multiple sugar transport system permease protein